uniref:Aminomethyltransferase folate-binding domain-containing protein n=1 Tax=Parascaris univalens TaxID=6257 RepID=A0A915BPX7_PARUN
GAVQALPMTKRSLVHLVQRALLVVKGADSRQFLQGLTTNDLRLLHKSGALYTLLLNNRGRIEYDLIVYEGVDGLLVECDNQRRDALKRLLEVYRMHKAVSIEKCGMNVFFVENVYDGAVVDPRVPAFGSRLLSDGLPGYLFFDITEAWRRLNSPYVQVT